MQFHRILLLSTLLLVTPGIMRSQERPISMQSLTRGEAESLLKDLASHEEAWEQSCRRVAAIYREISALSESDSTAVRELKRQYERLADNEERSAATAAERIAMYRARLAALLHTSADAPKRHYVFGDSAYRK